MGNKIVKTYILENYTKVDFFCLITNEKILLFMDGIETFYD